VNRAHGWDPYSLQGKRAAMRTIDAALGAGINCIDTAPSYGEGYSERLIGEATQRRRDSVFLWTKVPVRDTSPDRIRASLESSLERLRTDYVDVVQLHGGGYALDDVERILDGGLLDALERVREAGLARYIGFTGEDAWSMRSLVAADRFDLLQVTYNIAHQSARMHLLDEAGRAGLGVVAMRPMTSGFLQHTLSYLAPDCPQAQIYPLALKFVLSDSRVHAANVGMRSPAEVIENVALAKSFDPPLDIAELPDRMKALYCLEDRVTQSST
jgi:aryl-alcohol dehydrogenase-like predicted oxidoreductase